MILSIIFDTFLRFQGVQNFISKKTANPSTQFKGEFTAGGADGNKSYRGEAMDLKLIENGLIKVYETDADEKVVNARELHQGLEVGKDFSTWIKDRIEKYGFKEDEDYILLTDFGEQKGSGGHNRIEYIIKLDMAKEIAMVQNNEIGKHYRRYLIEVEKKYKAGVNPKAFDEITKNLGYFMQTATKTLELMDFRIKELEKKEHPTKQILDIEDKLEDIILKRLLRNRSRRSAVDILDNDLRLEVTKRILSCKYTFAEISEWLEREYEISISRSALHRYSQKLEEMLDL